MPWKGRQDSSTQGEHRGTKKVETTRSRRNARRFAPALAETTTFRHGDTILIEREKKKRARCLKEQSEKKTVSTGRGGSSARGLMWARRDSDREEGRAVVLETGREK